MRIKFDEQLAMLDREIIYMGALCENAIAMAAKALLDGDMELAKKAVMIEGEIDQKERVIENLCLKLLMQQQPVARDLRQISAALKMITDMERIGDQACDIAEIVMVTDIRPNEDTAGIADMARATIKMVTESVDAYVRQDTVIAQSVIDYDDVVDNLFDQVRNSLIALLGKKPNDGAYALDLLMIAKYLERIGDHATNIAEWVVFSITGVHVGGSAE